jgi:hypothetical protein
MGRILVLSAPRIRALANLGTHVRASAQSVRSQPRTLARRHAKEITQMKYRTAVKTGRTAAMQADGLRPGSFVSYAAMVERLSLGYIRPLVLRHRAPKPGP